MPVVLLKLSRLTTFLIRFAVSIWIFLLPSDQYWNWNEPQILSAWFAPTFRCSHNNRFGFCFQFPYFTSFSTFQLFCSLVILLKNASSSSSGFTSFMLIHLDVSNHRRTLTQVFTIILNKHENRPSKTFFLKVAQITQRHLSCQDCFQFCIQMK